LGQKNLPAKLPSETRPAYQRGLRIGNPGHVGAGGRPSKASLIRYEYLLSSAQHCAYLEAVANGEHGPQAFLNLHHAMMERLEGKVAQTTVLEGSESKPLRILIERESARDEG
jgi:hypothetical protein